MLDKKIKLQINILAEYQNQVESNLSKKYIKEIFELLRRKYELNEDPEDIDICIENLEESLYRPNDPDSQFFKPKHVYNFRKNMIDDFNYYLKKYYI